MIGFEPTILCLASRSSRRARRTPGLTLRINHVFCGLSSAGFSDLLSWLASKSSHRRPTSEDLTRPYGIFPSSGRACCALLSSPRTFFPRGHLNPKWMAVRRFPDARSEVLHGRDKRSVRRSRWRGCANGASATKESGGEAEPQGGVGPGREAETRSLRSALGAAHSGARRTVEERREGGMISRGSDPTGPAFDSARGFTGAPNRKVSAIPCRW